MLKKLNSLQSKLLLLIAIIATTSQSLSAMKSCNYRVFNINTSEKVTSIELLSQIADSCDFSIVVKDSFASEILEKELYSINIKNLSLNEIFGVLISDNDLFYDYNKNFLKISALKTKTFRVDYVSSVRKGTANINASVDPSISTTTSSGDEEAGNYGDGGASGDNSIKSVEAFDFWSTMLGEITAILNNGSEEHVAKSPIINSNAGLITVTGTKRQIDRVAKYLNTIQKSLHKQVIIDVNILSVGLSEKHDTGIDWSKMQLELKSTSKFNNSSSNASGTHNTYRDPIDRTLTFADNKLAIVNDAVFSMSGLINFLNKNGDTQVVSSPKILAMNNQQALITIGDNINYRVKTKSKDVTSATSSSISETYTNFSIFVGVLLNITPQITDNNEIILRINPSVSNFKYSNDDGKQIRPREIAPDTSEKKLSTIVKVKNGNTIILGGLITRSEVFDKSSVPVLGSIPLLGRLFRHEGRKKITQEMIFTITPRIISPRDDTKATLKDLGFSKKIYDK